MGDEIEISAIVGFCCPPLREAEALRSGPGSERWVGTYVFANFFLTYGQLLANFKRSVLGGGGGRPDYRQKLKVPEGFSAVSKPNSENK